MGQVLHGCARTTEAVRREIRHSKESVNVLSKRQFCLSRRLRCKVQNFSNYLNFQLLSTFRKTS